MAINVNFTELSNLASQIDGSLQDLTDANGKASTAGDNAVAAAGGDATAVGAAIRAAIQEDTNNEFGSALKVLSEMTAAMRTVSNTYSNENDELLRNIKTIASRGGGGDSGLGALAGGPNAASHNVSQKAF